MIARGVKEKVKVGVTWVMRCRFGLVEITAALFVELAV